MGTDSIAKYLNVRTVMATIVLVIISLCGTIMVLKDGSINAMVDAKIKAAMECAHMATQSKIDTLDREKVDVAVYVSDQKAIRDSLTTLKENSDMLIRLQLQGKKSADVDRVDRKAFQKREDADK